MDAVRGAGAVDADADHVEADLGESRLVPALGQPGTSEASDLDLLSGPDRLQRHLGGRRPGATAGLDLDEDQRRGIAADDVDLAVTGPRVTLDQLPSPAEQVARRRILSDRPERPPGVGRCRVSASGLLHRVSLASVPAPVGDALASFDHGGVRIT